MKPLMAAAGSLIWLYPLKPYGAVAQIWIKFDASLICDRCLETP